MSATIRVFIVVGTPKEGPQVDLAKFFSRADAESHTERYQREYRSVRVDERTESVAEQHPAHAEHVAAILKPKAAPAVPAVPGKPALVTNKPS